MQYTVFLQTRKDGGYLAWVPTLPVCLSEGNTREETLEKIRDAIKETLTNVVEITKVEVELPPASQNEADPWLKHRGMFADDPDFDEFLQEIETYRQELDNE